MSGIDSVMPGPRPDRALRPGSWPEEGRQDASDRFELLLAMLSGRVREGASAAVPGDRSPSAAAAAEIFNEHGFFVASASMQPCQASELPEDAEGTSTAVAHERSVPAVDGQPPSFRNVERDVRAPSAPQSAGRGAEPGRAVPKDGALVTRGLASPRAAPVAGSPGIAAATTTDRSSGAAAAGGSGRRAAARRPLPTAGDGATNPVRLTLQAVGAEASLVARADALTREERARLRTEIVQLLARHGFNAVAIRLNGEAGPGGRS